MNLWNLGQRRSRANALEQFTRFLALNRDRYSKLVSSGFSALNELGFNQVNHHRLASACRGWLPHLTDSVDRDLCRGVMQLHDSLASQDCALELLHVALLAECDRERYEAASVPVVDPETTLPYNQRSPSRAA